MIWRKEVSHPDEGEIPNNELDRRSATAGIRSGLVGTSARGGFPLAETAPASRKK